MRRTIKLLRRGEPGTAGADAESALAREHEGPAGDEAAAGARCRACGGGIADVLLRLGSLDCHDCRGGFLHLA